MSNTIRTTITITLSFDTPAGVDRESRLRMLDDMLVAAERAAVKATAEAGAGATRVRLNADLNDATADIF